MIGKVIFKLVIPAKKNLKNLQFFHVANSKNYYLSKILKTYLVLMLRNEETIIYHLLS